MYIPEGNNVMVMRGDSQAMYGEFDPKTKITSSWKDAFGLKAITSEAYDHVFWYDIYEAGHCVETDITNENMNNVLLCVDDIGRCPRAFKGDQYHSADFCCMIAHVSYGHYTRPVEYYED